MAVRAGVELVIGHAMPPALFAGAVAGGIVVVLTWFAMPLWVRIAGPWLRPPASASTFRRE
jgi:antibiotic biosynthesis monooxygenase (ABM) superfamily enzyme